MTVDVTKPLMQNILCCDNNYGLNRISNPFSCHSNVKFNRVILTPVKCAPSLIKAIDWLKNRKEIKEDCKSKSIKERKKIFVPQSPFFEEDETVISLSPCTPMSIAKNEVKHSTPVLTLLSHDSPSTTPILHFNKTLHPTYNKQLSTIKEIDESLSSLNNSPSSPLKVMFKQ